MAKSTRFGIDICNALGLNPGEVAKIDISIEPRQLIKVSVSLTPDYERSPALCDVLRKYHLVPIEPESVLPE